MQKKTPPLQKNQDIPLKIEALGSEGQGIGRVDGYTVFVPGVLPGEEIIAHVIKAGASYGVGKCKEILVPTEARVSPPCPRNGICGGCTLQHMSYDSQLVYKQKLVGDALTRLGGLADVQVQPVRGMNPPYAYRNKASFPFTSTPSGIDIGFFAPRSHRVVPADDCLLQQPRVMQAALAVRSWAREFNLTAYDEARHRGLLRHVVVREGSGGVMVTVVATDHLPHKKELIRALRAQAENVKSVYHNLHTARGNAILSGDFRLLYGSATIEETLLGLRFSLSPASFLQVNRAQAERLYTEALNALALTGEERVVDAYCGIGTITLQLARRAKEAIGIESVREAVIDAQRNATLNEIDNVRFLHGPAEELLPKLLLDGTALDALVLDPPRKGAEEAFLRAAIESRVKKIAYISCNPATLARDCSILSEGGYQLTHVQPVDLFCQTPHVETVCLMSRISSIQ